MTGLPARVARWARWLLSVALIIAGVVFGTRLARELRALLATVDGPGDPWIPDPADPGRILVTAPGADAPESVPLPAGVGAGDVRAVSVVPGGVVKVEVLP